MRLHYLKICAIGLLGFGYGVLALAQEKMSPRPMTLVDLNEMPSIGSIEISPDGSQVLFSKSTINWDEDRRDNHIWRVDIGGKNSTQMTNGENGEGGAKWSPDSRQIAFVAKRGRNKVSQIYLLNSSGGEAIQVGQHPTGVGSLEWAPDGKSILFLANDDWDKIKKTRRKNKDDMIRFDENPYRHIWRMDLNASEAEAITSGEFYVRFFNVSDDGTKIVHSRAPSALLDDLPNTDLWVMGADGSDAEQVTSDNIVLETNPIFGAEGKIIYFTADSSPDGQEYYYNDKLFSVSLRGGKPKILTAGAEFVIRDAKLSQSGRNIYLAVQGGVYNKVYEYNIKTGAITPLSKTADNVSSWDYNPATNTHVTILANAKTAGDLWTMEKGRGKVQLTHIFDYLSENFILPKVEVIKWAGEDGQVVEGILFYPIDYKEGYKYPLIVQTHGGPASADTMGRLLGSYSYQAVAAAHGYALFKPNYRGSTGYGDDFMRDMVGSYFNQSHLDVMTGVDHLIELGIADPDRLIKMGWSAGGHMTNKIITFTDRFKAASSGAGAVNWAGMYAQSDIRVYRTPWFGGTPWQKDAPIDVYWDNSPLKDIHKVTTPTLILVGEKDPRVPPPQSTELYRALKSNGVITEFYLAPGEPHGWRKPSHRIFKGNVELDWFAKHALGKAYEWEKVPTTDVGNKKEDGGTYK